MGNSIQVGYVGFEAKNKVREYKFVFRATGLEPREFSLTIANEAFLAHRVRYQDAPDICTRRLLRELAETSNLPAKTHYAITDEDLEEYRAAHTPKSRPRAMYKPNRED